MSNYWHCNPNKYDPNYYNSKVTKTAKEIWKYDEDRVNYIISKGFEQQRKIYAKLYNLGEKCAFLRNRKISQKKEEICGDEVAIIKTR